MKKRQPDNLCDICHEIIRGTGVLSPSIDGPREMHPWCAEQYLKSYDYKMEWPINFCDQFDDGKGRMKPVPLEFMINWIREVESAAFERGKQKT